MNVVVVAADFDVHIDYLVETEVHIGDTLAIPTTMNDLIQACSDCLWTTKAFP